MDDTKTTLSMRDAAMGLPTGLQKLYTSIYSNDVQQDFSTNMAGSDGLPIEILRGAGLGNQTPPLQQAITINQGASNTVLYAVLALIALWLISRKVRL